MNRLYVVYVILSCAVPKKDVKLSVCLRIPYVVLYLRLRKLDIQSGFFRMFGFVNG